MEVSASGSVHPSAVIYVVLVSFDCDVVFETCGSLNDEFADEGIIQGGIEDCNEHVFKCSCFGFGGLV